MATTSEQRHEKIRRAVLRRPEDVVDVSISLWERLAGELSSLIGEVGFHSLFSRSVHLAKTEFPWLAQTGQLPHAESRFAGLRATFEQRPVFETSEASIFLLITLIDIITLLIGEQLMNSILISAWGDEPLGQVGVTVQS